MLSCGTTKPATTTKHHTPDHGAHCKSFMVQAVHGYISQLQAAGPRSTDVRQQLELPAAPLRPGEHARGPRRGMVPGAGCAGLSCASCSRGRGWLARTSRLPMNGVGRGESVRHGAGGSVRHGPAQAGCTQSSAEGTGRHWQACTPTCSARLSARHCCCRATHRCRAACRRRRGAPAWRGRPRRRGSGHKFIGKDACCKLASPACVV